MTPLLNRLMVGLVLLLAWPLQAAPLTRDQVQQLLTLSPARQAIGAALDAHGDVDPDSRAARVLVPSLPVRRARADARRLLDRLVRR